MPEIITTMTKGYICVPKYCSTYEHVIANNENKNKRAGIVLHHTVWASARNAGESTNTYFISLGGIRSSTLD